MIDLTQKIALSLIVCILLGLSKIYAQSGTTYYVSSSQGSNNNAGTSSGQAWKTLSKIESTNLQPGDRVLLRRGDTWSEQLSLDGIQGENSTRIVIGAYGAGSAARPLLNPTDRSRVIEIEDCSYIVVENLRIQVSQDKSGILIRGDSRYCTVRNCLVRSDRGNVGVIYSAYSEEMPRKRPTYSIISNCEVSGFREGIVGRGGINGGGRIENNYVHSSRTDRAGDLIRAHGDKDEKTGDFNGLLITGNRVTRWSDDAIDLYTGSGIIVEYNEVYRGDYPIFDNGENNGSGNGIKLGGITNASSPAPTSSGNIARYNKIYDLSPRKSLPGNRNILSNGIDTNGNKNAKIYGNLIYDVEGNAIAVTNEGAKVYNNTGFSGRQAALFAKDHPIEVRNNIFGGASNDISSKGARVTGSNNILVNDKFSGSEGGTYNSTNDLSGNPGFVDPSNNNYQLRATSIAIDAGAPLDYYSEDREGDPIVNITDIGSDEFVGDSNPPPTGSTDIWLEGECATIIGDEWEVVSDGAASQSRYLRAKPGAFQRDTPPTRASAQVTYNFSVDRAGAYKISTRHLSFDGDDDSFWIRVNSGEWTSAYLGENRGAFTWAQLGTDATYSLSAGDNSITVAFREPDARLDKIYITLNGGLPTGIGGTAESCDGTTPPASADVWLEAECGTLATTGSFWSIEVNDSNASQGSVLRANTAFSGSTNSSVNDARRQVSFSFTITEAGNYHLFARHTRPGSTGSSFIFRVDDGAWQTWKTTQTGSLAWQETIVSPFSLSAGEHTITFVNHRKDSRLDKLLLSTSNTPPSGLGGAVSNCSATRTAYSGTGQEKLRHSAINEASLQLSVYPNPADEQLTIEFEETSARPKAILLTNLMGKTIRRWKYSNEKARTLRVNTRDIPNGVYLLKGSSHGIKPIRLFVNH